jgi:alpha-glucosidase
MLLTLRGTPTIYYGDELGMPETQIPTGREVDPWGIRVPGLGRDGCRTPMQWDPSPGAGFSSAAPWLPLGSDHATRNVATQSGSSASMLELYRSLLSYRRSSAVLRSGSYRSYDAGEGVFAFERALEGHAKVAVVIAFAESRMARVPAGTVVLSSAADRSGESVAGEVELRADEALVIELA